MCSASGMAEEGIKMINWKTLTIAATMAVGMFAGAAQAATTTVCPGTAITTDREFTLTTQDPIGNTCFYTGAPNDANDAAFQAALLALSPPATLLGKIEYDEFGVLQVTGPLGSLLSDMVSLLGGSGGDFELDLTGIVNAILVFKVGGATFNPDYAAFAVDSGEVEGTWSNVPRQGAGLSHVTLYGSVAPVPLPAAGLMLLGALGGLAALRRRRRTA
jgi:hypothetical protein